jgi:hypothetical protein
MTRRAELDDRRSRPASMRAQGSKVASVSFLAVTRSTPLFVPYQGVIR